MKKFYLLIIFILSCGDVGEQKIGYVEIVENAWELFSEREFEQARTEFTNALDYQVLNNIAEAYIGIGWCNLYIANEFTDITNSNARNELRDIAYNNFISAQEHDDEATDQISDEMKAIMFAGLVFVYDYRLLDFNEQYYNDECPECQASATCDLDDFRSNCIIPLAKNIVIESNNLIDKQENFQFPYDPTINIDDIRFIRARLAFSFDDFESLEFQNNGINDVGEYFIHQQEICFINDFTQDCLELGFEQYCIDGEPNIPVEDFLGCLSSFYTPSLNP